MKRAFDITVSLVMLALTLPFFVFAALGIKLSSSGPVFFPASRIGLKGEMFAMLKFRSMHVSNEGAVITSRNDNRIFRFGSLLRSLKIDELPQFINVLKDDMSIVGPRPEDPKIVKEAYEPWMMNTLDVRPGITSPGAIFYYAKGEKLIDQATPEASYIARILPPKLAIERAYIARATLLSDLIIIIHTAAAILGEAMGRPVSPSLRDIKAAEQWVSQSAFDMLP